MHNFNSAASLIFNEYRPAIARHTLRGDLFVGQALAN